MCALSLPGHYTINCVYAEKDLTSKKHSSLVSSYKQTITNKLDSQLLMCMSVMQGVMGKAAAAAVQSVWAQDGPEAARLLYRHMLTLAPSGMAIFHAILDLEISGEAGGPSKPGHGRICKVFEVCSAPLVTPQHDPEQ